MIPIRTENTLYRSRGSLYILIVQGILKNTRTCATIL